MAEDKGRIVWLDAAKGVAIALVVAAHSIGGEWSYVLSPIRMPIFFVAAGFTLNLTKWQNRKYEFFCSRVKRLLVPYFLLELLFWPIWSVRGMFLPPVGTKLPPFDALVGILGGNSVDLPLIALWFLPCYKLSCWTHLPWGLDIALFVQGFILAGRWLRAKELESISDFWCLLLPIILLAVQSHINNYFNMAARMYGLYPMLAYAAVIGGSIMLMRVMQLLVHDTASFLAEMGRRSMAIYLLHPLVQIIFSDILLLTIVEGDYGTLFYLWQAGVPIVILGILLPIYVSRNYSQKPLLRYLGL